MCDPFGRQTSATDPDLGTTTTSYTPLDQTDTTTDSRGTKLLYAYDVLGRKTDQWQTSQTDANKLAHWDYDTTAKGQLYDSISYVGGSGSTGSAYTRKVTAYDNLYHATGAQLTLPSTGPLVTKGAVASATLATTSYYNIDGTQQRRGDHRPGKTARPAPGVRPTQPPCPSPEPACMCTPTQPRRRTPSRADRDGLRCGDPAVTERGAR